MGVSGIAMATLCLVVLATTMHISMAQNIQNILAAHNRARAQVGVGPMGWSSTLAAYAQRYANSMVSTCNLVHSGGPYGENLAWQSNNALTYTAAVNMWVSERQYYNYNSNSCASGKACGHYTQVVWRNSVNVGCGRVICNSGATFIICNYSPPGNVVGRKPY